MPHPKIYYMPVKCQQFLYSTDNFSAKVSNSSIDSTSFNALSIFRQRPLISIFTVSNIALAQIDCEKSKFSSILNLSAESINHF